MHLILTRISWSDLSKEVRHTQRNREVYSPTISLYRWWARRSHTLFGALIERAIEEFGSTEFIMSDPFSGGGTAAIEADRRGLAVYAQEIQPWPAWGLSIALDRVEPEDLERASSRWLDSLQPIASTYYGTTCPEHGDQSSVMHTFWVQRVTCSYCGQKVYLYPDPLITYMHRVERSDDQRLGFYGCPRCGRVSKHTIGGLFECEHCGYEGDSNPWFNPREVACPHCGKKIPLKKTILDGLTDRVPVLVQRLCSDNGKRVTHFSMPTEDEVTQALAPAGREVPRDPIPPGKETAKLTSWGYQSWQDLYPPRQSGSFLEASDALSDLTVPDPIKRRLQLTLCGATEMAGFSSRWDRYHLKAFESVANHRFAASTLSVEVNPFSPLGRGTIPRRLKHSIKAAKWAKSSGAEVKEPALLVPFEATEHLPTQARAVIVIGSSERQTLPDRCVQLVITDPPYFDDVQYGELSQPFCTWATRFAADIPRIVVDTSREAVPNRFHGVGIEEYKALLTAILKETRRTLRDDGIMLLTYHNTKMPAWVALGQSLYLSGFIVRTLAVAHSENESDHAKRGRLSFSKDLVLECGLGVATSEPIVASPVIDDEDAELVAIGLSVATNAAAGEEAILRGYFDRLPVGTSRRIW